MRREQTIGWAILGALSLGALLHIAASWAEGAEKGLAVHEWGTFTSVSGTDGELLEWRPLLGPDDLPGFIYGPNGSRGDLRKGRRGKLSRTATVRMETPVVYFYSDRAIDVSLRVEFPLGWITEWFPAADEIERGLDWVRVSVVPDTPNAFPREDAPSHYYPARETDAAPLRVGEESEKFLFYRGLGTFDLPLRVSLSDSKLTLRNQVRDPLAPVLVFENRGGRTGVRVIPKLEGQAIVDRPELTAGTDRVKAVLLGALVAHGLYKKEAAAMIRTWEDTWFEEGLRVFSIVPRTVTDDLLPLTISPRPTTLVRVLVSRIEVLAPELEAAVAQAIDKILDPERGEEGRRDLVGLGRFAEPILRRSLNESQDPAVRAILLAALYH